MRRLWPDPYGCHLTSREIHVRNHRLTSLIGAALIAFAATPALAATGDGAWRCEWLTLSSSPIGNCHGSRNPPPNDLLATINAQFGTGYTEVYKDENEATGSDVPLYFDALETGDARGTITFATDFADPFVLAIKLGQAWSAYRFDTDFLAGSTLSWTPNGSFNFGATAGVGLGHAAIYSLPVEAGATVPEPGTLALLGIGVLGLVGMQRRRSKGARPSLAAGRKPVAAQSMR
jgi:hypothetical protein